MIHGHGGDVFAIAASIGCQPEDIVDFSSNMNPLGPPAELVRHLEESLHRITFLPDPGARPAIEAFAAYHAIPREEVIAGNGTTQLIYALPLILSSTRALIVSPTYSDYADACRMHRVPHTLWYTKASDGFDIDIDALGKAAGDADTIFICNPNNPTGRIISDDAITRLSRELTQARLVIDESYLPFVDESRCRSLVKERPDNVIVLHSLSKIFRIPGLRIGFLVAAPEIVKMFEAFQKPWSINGLAQVAVEYLMTHAGLMEGFITRSRRYVDRERASFIDRLAFHSQVDVIPSETVFILARLPEGRAASDLKSGLLKRKILIRDCANFNGLDPRYFRMSLKSSESNRQLIDALVELFPVETEDACRGGAARRRKRISE